MNNDVDVGQCCRILRSFKVPQIKEICRSCRLPTNMKKQELLDMLCAFIKNQQDKTTLLAIDNLVQRAVVSPDLPPLSSVIEMIQNNSPAGVDPQLRTARYESNGGDHRTHRSTTNMATPYRGPNVFFRPSIFYQLIDSVGNSPILGLGKRKAGVNPVISLSFMLDDNLKMRLSNKRYRVFIMAGKPDSGTPTSPEPITYPGKMGLTVNGVVIDITKGIGLKTDPFTNRPFDITDYITPGTNVVRLTFDDPSNFLMYCYLANSFSTQEVIDKTTIPMYKKVDELKRIKKYYDSNDDGLQFASMKMSLRCPLTTTPIKTPIKSLRCDHVQCYDLYNFLEAQRLSNSWRCPVCHKATVFGDLRLSEYVSEILQKTKSDVITIGADGDIEELSHNSVSNSKPPSVSRDIPLRRSKRSEFAEPEVIVISDSDSEEEIMEDNIMEESVDVTEDSIKPKEDVDLAFQPVSRSSSEDVPISQTAGDTVHETVEQTVQEPDNNIVNQSSVSQVNEPQTTNEQINEEPQTTSSPLTNEFQDAVQTPEPPSSDIQDNNESAIPIVAPVHRTSRQSIIDDDEDDDTDSMQVDTILDEPVSDIVNKPVENKSEKSTAKEKAPEEKAPEEKAPEEKAPEEKAPEMKVPEKKAPARKTSEQKTSEKKTTEKKTTENGNKISETGNKPSENGNQTESNKAGTNKVPAISPGVSYSVLRFPRVDRQSVGVNHHAAFQPPAAFQPAPTSIPPNEFGGASPESIHSRFGVTNNFSPNYAVPMSAPISGNVSGGPYQFGNHVPQGTGDISNTVNHSRGNSMGYNAGNNPVVYNPVVNYPIGNHPVGNNSFGGIDRGWAQNHNSVESHNSFSSHNSVTSHPLPTTNKTITHLSNTSVPNKNPTNHAANHVTHNGAHSTVETPKPQTTIQSAKLQIGQTTKPQTVPTTTPQPGQTSKSQTGQPTIPQSVSVQSTAPHVSSTRTSPNRAAVTFKKSRLHDLISSIKGVSSKPEDPSLSSKFKVSQTKSQEPPNAVPNPLSNLFQAQNVAKPTSNLTRSPRHSNLGQMLPKVNGQTNENVNSNIPVLPPPPPTAVKQRRTVSFSEQVVDINRSLSQKVLPPPPGPPPVASRSTISFLEYKSKPKEKEPSPSKNLQSKDSQPSGVIQSSEPVVQSGRHVPVGVTVQNDVPFERTPSKTPTPGSATRFRRSPTPPAHLVPSVPEPTPVEKPEELIRFSKPQEPPIDPIDPIDPIKPIDPIDPIESSRALVPLDGLSQLKYTHHNKAFVQHKYNKFKQAYVEKMNKSLPPIPSKQIRDVSGFDFDLSSPMVVAPVTVDPAIAANFVVDEQDELPRRKHKTDILMSGTPEKRAKLNDSFSMSPLNGRVNNISLENASDISMEYS